MDGKLVGKDRFKKINLLLESKLDNSYYFVINYLTFLYSRGEGADMYGMGGPGGYHHRSDSPMSGYHPPARSPTGSHSTPSPHSQVINQSQE